MIAEFPVFPRKRFRPVIGQVARHIASIVNLVAAELGVSLVPAAMMQLRVTGIVYRQIAGHGVYQHDDNYLVPHGLSAGGRDSDILIGAYTLRSRMDELRELRPAEAWASREAELRGALQEAADGLLAVGSITAEVHEKYFLSLTDQEIIHGLPGYKSIASEAQRTGDSEGPRAIAFIREIVEVESGKRNDRPQLAAAGLKPMSQTPYKLNPVTN